VPVFAYSLGISLKRFSKVSSFPGCTIKVLIVSKFCFLETLFKKLACWFTVIKLSLEIPEPSYASGEPASYTKPDQLAKIASQKTERQNAPINQTIIRIRKRANTTGII
jgi:hypothetical protein